MKKLIFAILFLSGAITIFSQQPIFDKKNLSNRKQLPAPDVKLVKRDPVSYHPAPIVVNASATIATADQLYLGQGSFLVRTVRDYRYLTVKDDLSRSSIVFQFASWAQASQLWNFILQPGGYYKIRSGEGLFLELGGRTMFYVVSKAEAANDKQLWQLEPTTNGNYYIRSKTGPYLSVTNNSVADGTVATASATLNGNNEKWHLIKMTNDGRRVTTFDPVRNGFHFINTFNGEDIIRWGGLCGGMVYTALDYFRNRISIPTQSWTPANATALQSYIYQRQQHSMWNVNEKWSELEVAYNIRAGEIFRWGIQGTGGGRLEQVKNSIDAGISRPIGLFGGGVRGLDNSDGSRHVVLAMGYTLGRYRGDFTGYMGDYKIFCWDPNMRNQMVTIVPDIEGQCYFEIESGRAWRTYFVNDRYDNDHTPPRDIPNFPEAEPEGSIRHLYVEFLTGGDDLRGGSDNVNLTVNYTDGTREAFLNVNNGARWVDNSTQTIHIQLNRAIRKSDIRNFMINATFGSGDGSDDWNLDGFEVTTGLGGIVIASSFAEPGSYIFRFSGDQRRLMHAVLVR